MADSKKGESRGAQRPSFRSVLGSLTEEWSIFYQVLFSPGVLLLIFACVGLIFVTETGAGETQLPAAVRVVLTAVVSVLASVVGALVWKRWTERADSGVLVTRGKSAVRGLTLLLQSIGAAEARVLRLRPAMVADSPQSERFLTICDEVLDRLNLLQEETKNAIEEWTDIIPDANITTQIGLITNLKKRAAELEEEFGEIAQRAKESDDAKEELSAELEEKKVELREVREDLNQRELAMSSSVLSGINRSPMLELLSNFRWARLDSSVDAKLGVCPHCRTGFDFDGLKSLSECPSCGYSLEEGPISINVDFRKITVRPPTVKSVTPGAGRDKEQLDSENEGDD